MTALVFRRADRREVLKLRQGSERALPYRPRFAASGSCEQWWYWISGLFPENVYESDFNLGCGYRIDWGRCLIWSLGW